MGTGENGEPAWLDMRKWDTVITIRRPDNIGGMCGIHEIEFHNPGGVSLDERVKSLSHVMLEMVAAEGIVIPPEVLGLFADYTRPGRYPSPFDPVHPRPPSE